MNCQEYRELFSDFLGDELSEEQAESFREHLRSCEACREEHGKFRQAQTLLKLLPKKEAPPELWKVIEAEMRPVEQRLVFFSQSVTTFERFRLRERSPPPIRIYGVSFRVPRRK